MSNMLAVSVLYIDIVNLSASNIIFKSKYVPASEI